MKWMREERLVLVIDILPIIFSLGCAIFIKPSNYIKYTIDLRLATIVAGITMQIILIGFQLRWLIKENKDKNENILTSINGLETSINDFRQFLSFKNCLDKIWKISEKKRISFAARRLKELKDKFENFATQKEIKLSSEEYYKELKYLIEILDKDNNKNDCEIWAQTFFSIQEWGYEASDSERYWDAEILKLAKQINTKRTCFVDDDLLKLLNGKEQSYYESQMNAWTGKTSPPNVTIEKKLKSFYDYLSIYYGEHKNEYKVTSIVLDKNSLEYKGLFDAGGFFGIKLSDGNMHVIEGENYNAVTGLEGQYVLVEENIDELYKLHNRACTEGFCQSLADFISKKTCDGFRAFLNNHGVKMR